MPINLDLARLHVTTPECREVISPVPMIMLPPLQEQVVAEEVPTAAPLVQEQAAPEEIAPEEAEMVKEEVLEEQPAIDEALLLFGQREENLSVTNRVRLKEQRKQWQVEDRINQQKEQDAQIALQLQANKQRKAAHPVQLGPVKRTVAPPTEEEVARAQRAFGDFVIDDTEPTVAQPMEEEEARLANQAFKPRSHILEIIEHSSDEDLVAQ